MFLLESEQSLILESTMQLGEVIRNPSLIGVCNATPMETMFRDVLGIQANGCDGFCEKAGKRECDGLAKVGAF